MNLAHALICSSGWWRRTVERELLPWALNGVELGDDVLEIGPGYGATTRVLARNPGRLSIAEIDPGYCERLSRSLGGTVEVVQADARRLPFEDDRFSSVVCFTMLHHLPSPAAQDELLAQAARVLRPGGVFAGSDSLGTGKLFRIIHARDTLVPVDPAGLAERLDAAGLSEAQVSTGGSSFRFRARRPQAARWAQ